jgi:adenylate kinase
MKQTDRYTNHSSPRVILFLGAPGSGKGTQSSWLSDQLGIPTLSTGEALRTEAKRSTAAAVRLRRVLASGELVSDETVCEVVAGRLRRDRPERGLILDGFPRTLKQAIYLDALLDELNLPRPTVIHLQVSEEGLLRRLSARRHCAVCGAVYNLISRPSLRGPRCEHDGGLLVERDDDREEVIVRRLREFESATAPLIQYYRKADFHQVNGDRGLDDVAAELMNIAGAKQLSAAA